MKRGRARSYKTALAALTAAAALLFMAVPFDARSASLDLEPETVQLLVEAVESAATLDAYNARCRSDVSGRYTDSLNRELAERLRTTVVSVQDDLFPEKSFRDVQTRLKEQFQEELRAAGGCKGAKESGLADRWRQRYDERMATIDALP